MLKSAPCVLEIRAIWVWVNPPPHPHTLHTNLGKKEHLKQRERLGVS